MNDIDERYCDVAIVGGGPVGLYLALILRQFGIDCIVFEKRAEPITHSRSLGIHPVSLELLNEIGIADAFLREGVRIRSGIAFSGTRQIGTISFQSCPGPYRFVLALPQYRTEALLERHLAKKAPGVLVRDAEVTSIDERRDSVAVHARKGEKAVSVSARLLVGCDGKESFVRKAASFSFEGSSYPDTYIMGDFVDNTLYRSEALIFLCKEGLIESFPLPESRRRWVVKTDGLTVETGRPELEKLVAERIGHSLGGVQHEMISSFGVQKYIARPMAGGRIFLAGDAAHIVTPIGGQGMNLGWMDARNIAALLAKPGNSIDRDIQSVAKHYSLVRTAVARKAIGRGELNMHLGRKTRWPCFRDGLVWLLLNTPLQHVMARTFTMRGLERWPF